METIYLVVDGQFSFPVTKEKFIQVNTEGDVGGLTDTELASLNSIQVNEKITIGNCSVQRIPDEDN